MLEDLPLALQQQLRDKGADYWQLLMHDLYSNTMASALAVAIGLEEVPELIEQARSLDANNPDIKTLDSIALCAHARLWRLASTTLFSMRHQPLIDALLEPEANPGPIWGIHNQLSESYTLLLGLRLRRNDPEDLSELIDLLPEPSILQEAKAHAQSWIDANLAPADERQQWLEQQVSRRCQELGL